MYLPWIPLTHYYKGHPCKNYYPSNHYHTLCSRYACLYRSMEINVHYTCVVVLQKVTTKHMHVLYMISNLCNWYADSYLTEYRELFFCGEFPSSGVLPPDPDPPWLSWWLTRRGPIDLRFLMGRGIYMLVPSGNSSSSILRLALIRSNLCSS